MTFSDPKVTFGEAPFSDERLRDEYILVGDVLLMPMRAFAVGSAGYTMPSEYPWSDKFVTHGFQVRVASQKQSHTLRLRYRIAQMLVSFFLFCLLSA